MLLSIALIGCALSASLSAYGASTCKPLKKKNENRVWRNAAIQHYFQARTPESHTRFISALKDAIGDALSVYFAAGVLNGICQGFCWPPIGLLLKRWFEPKIRGSVNQSKEILEIKKITLISIHFKLKKINAVVVRNGLWQDYWWRNRILTIVALGFIVIIQYSKLCTSFPLLFIETL